MNIVNAYIILSFIWICFNYYKKPEYWFVFSLVGIAVLNEMLTLYFVSRNIVYNIGNTTYLLLHNFIWLYILFRMIRHKKIVMMLGSGYLVLGVINLLYFEGTSRFNYNTFIVGALLYVILFIVESFKELKDENLAFFTSNNFLLFFAPVFFFIGLSAIFGFKSAVLGSTILIGKIKLYEFIVTFVSLVYYSLINIYIYREKRILNG